MQLAHKLSNDSRVKELFRKQNICLAYLFGSQAHDRTTALSDVDIAVLFSSTISPKTYSDRQVELITQFMSILSRNDIDVVVLNAAPPLLCYKAIEVGQIILCSSEKERVHFEVSALRDYLDTKNLREVQNRILERRYINQPKLGRTAHG